MVIENENELIKYLPFKISENISYSYWFPSTPYQNIFKNVFTKVTTYLI